MEDVPVVDLLGECHETLVATVDMALRRYGFFYVANHGIEESLLQQQFQVAADIFDLPFDEKRSMPFDPELDIGYVGSGVQYLDPNGAVQHSGDTKEQFMMTNNNLITDTTNTATTNPDDVFAGSKNFAPNVPHHSHVTREYGSAAFKLNRRLNTILFDALDLDDDMRLVLGKEPFMVLKQMRYAADPSDPAAGKFGAGAHTDWGSFTILATDETPGLQIQMDHDVWLPVPPRKGCLIINSGDQIAHLTNGYYRSAMHRVVIAPQNGRTTSGSSSSSATTTTAALGTPKRNERFSTAVFTYFGIDAMVGPMAKFVSDDNPEKYPHRTTREYFHFKLIESMGTGGY